MTAVPAASPRTRLPFAAACAAAAVLLGLTACGGGDELAPPDPEVEGPGMAVVQLDGVEVGSTPLVTSGLASTRDLTVEETGEVVTFEGDPPVARLSRANLAPSVPGPCFMEVFDSSDPAIQYLAGPAPTGQFTIDSNNGILTANSDGAGGYLIADGTEVVVDYCYFATVYSVEVGISLPEGDYFSLSFHNLPEGVSGMASTSVLSQAPPGDGSLAYFAFAARDLTILSGARLTVVDDPAVNLATIISADLRNLLNPCIEGTVVTLVESSAGAQDSVLEVDFDDPDCPL